jgi:hypothetical protein
VEIILAADGEIRFRVRRVERNAQLVQIGLDQGAAVFLVEHGAVGIEQDVTATVFQITHHTRQIFDQHRLADAVQYGALQLRDLIDDRREQFPAHIGRRLELGVSARACGAKKIAAVGGFKIKTNRIVFGNFTVRFDAFEIAPGIDRTAGLRSLSACRHTWHYRFVP